MRFTKISISNFRQHRNVTLDLTSPKADLLVVRGTMGAGKTNLLNAINWAIYGDVEDSELGPLKLLSYSSQDEIQIGDYRDVEVSLDIALDDGSTAYLHRSQSFKKVSAKLSEPYGDSKLTISVFRTIENGNEVESDPAQWVEKYLPRRFRSYFLFDGEKLERFFKESDAPRIRAAIQEVAQIDVLERLQRNLNAYASDVAKSAAKLTGADGEKLVKQLSDIDQRIADAMNLISTQEALETQHANAEAELDGQLVQYGAAEANINRKRKLSGEIDALETKISDAKVRLEQALRRVAPSAFLSKAIHKLNEKIEEAELNGVLPPPVNPNYLNELLEKSICICGTNLDDGSQARAHIVSTVEKYDKVSVVGAALNEHRQPCTALLARLEPEFLLAQAENDLIQKALLDHDEKEDELRGLSLALADINDETLRQLALDRETARTKALSARAAKHSAKAELDRLKLERVEILRDIQQVASTNSELAQAQKKARFAEALASTATDLYESMNNRVRNAVANSLDEQFKAMTWKKQYFESVTIDEDFLVQVTNNRGIPVIADLSAGERLCLAFAFALTLSKEAGLNFPIFVDTPMGRLAPEVQANLSQVICDATRGSLGQANHQMALLMTETEYNPRVAEVLAQRDPLVLSISFNEQTAETEIA